LSHAALADIAKWPEIAVAPAPALAGPGRIDLWCFDYEAALAGAVVGDEELPHPLRQAYLDLLIPEERARHDRFIFARDRLQFLATRALVRTVLSQYEGVAPTAWRFATGERGKPYITAPTPAQPLAFNLSNTRGLIVCAVSGHHALLGCDTEDVTRRTETVGIADHYFSPREVAALKALPASQHQARFFAYWTLKESYIKARGLGLALPLSQFSFLLDAGPEIGIEFDPRLGDDARRWRFALRRFGPRHFVALGVDTGGQSLAVQVANFVPLVGRTPLPSGVAAGEARP
jgi:4'-phosphopantetheinyl transferase